MYEIRIHGLGGQGVVTLTDILALACFYEGWQTQAFPAFGPERTGAPVMGFVRLDKQAIKVRQQIYSPDLIIVLADSLLDTMDVAEGAKPKARLLINTKRAVAEVSRLTKLPAAAITICQPPADLGQATNMFVLGQALKIYNLAGLNSCGRAIKAKLADKDAAVIKTNLTAVTTGYEQATTA